MLPHTFRCAKRIKLKEERRVIHRSCAEELQTPCGVSVGNCLSTILSLLRRSARAGGLRTGTGPVASGHETSIVGCMHAAGRESGMGGRYGESSVTLGVWCQTQR